VRRAAGTSVGEEAKVADDGENVLSTLT